MSKLGTFTFNGATFNAEYRVSTPANKWNQRGFDKCLVIGSEVGGSRSDGHSYFGDDKWEVVDATEYIDDIELTLKASLYYIEDIWSRTNKVTLKLKK